MAQLVSTQSKYAAYQQLILCVQSAYPVYQDSVVYDKNQLVWCDACKKEINLWSYWQGSLDAKIMLVGQDWGCPFDKSSLVQWQKFKRQTMAKPITTFSTLPVQRIKIL